MYRFRVLPCGRQGVYGALARGAAKVPGLELRHLLGRGGFGRVYYGTWNGRPVAVKITNPS